MRVAIVCPYDLGIPGGVQVQVTELARQLQALGDESWVVGPGPADRPLGRSVTLRGNRSRVPIALHPAVWRSTQAEVASADVVHVHEPFVPLVSPAALRAGRPVVATFHADPPRWVRGMYRVGGRIGQRLLRSAPVLTAVSTVAAASLPDAWAPVTIVPNGIDVSRYQVDVARHPSRIAFLGRDDPRKGLDLLLAAWDSIRSAHPGAELVVIGASRPEPRPEVEFLGRVDEETKIRTLAESSILVAPNLGGESFGLVVAEGMAAGCAVVASDLPAFRTVLDDTGRRFPVGDAAALAGTVTALLNDEMERARLGDAARRRAQTFDWSQIAGRYRELYERAARIR